MANQIPLVDYLVLGDRPHLVAKECTSCGARYFDRRNACVSLGMQVRLATEVVGTDDEGTEAIGFGFEPKEG